MTLSELIASEVMDVIERERRIIKDDFITAAEVAIAKFNKEQERTHPLMLAATDSVRTYSHAFGGVVCFRGGSASDAVSRWMVE